MSSLIPSKDIKFETTRNKKKKKKFWVTLLILGTACLSAKSLSLRSFLLFVSEAIFLVLIGEAVSSGKLEA
jgi:hypothetical protein